jgi:ribosome-associated protein
LSGDSNILNVDDRIQVPLSEFEFVFSRASGPGGQNVNKVSSRVQLRWLIAESSALPADVAERFRRLNRRRINTDGVFQISSQRYRDQSRNKADCLEKLAGLLEEASRKPRRRKRTRVPRRAHERRLAEKKRRSETKQRRQRPEAPE